MSKQIVDQYTDLPLSRQRKHQLRYPRRLQRLRRKHRPFPLDKLNRQLIFIQAALMLEQGNDLPTESLDINKGEGHNG